jgi:hypothetical protein
MVFEQTHKITLKGFDGFVRYAKGGFDQFFDQRLSVVALAVEYVIPIFEVIQNVVGGRMAA